jgi:DNA mismatch repair protein MSH5
MSDLEQMKTIIDEATSKSLVLIDEFGKGTLVEDGVALFTASVKWLIRESNPRLIAITHFHEIYQNGLLSDQNQIAHWTMDILLTSDSSKIECFLYKVKPLEKVVQSYGFFCAELAGLDPRLIERGNVVCNNRPFIVF